MEVPCCHYREFHLSRVPANASRAAIQQKVEAERAAEMSFRPHVAHSGHHSSHQAPPTSRAEHLEQLSRPRTALWARCMSPLTPLHLPACILRSSEHSASSPIYLQRSHTHTHTRTHARMHARLHPPTHPHMHIEICPHLCMG